jgi:hypothetical protein
LNVNQQGFDKLSLTAFCHVEPVETLAGLVLKLITNSIVQQGNDSLGNGFATCSFVRNHLTCNMFFQKHITTNLMLPYFLNLISAGEGSLPDY